MRLESLKKGRAMPDMQDMICMWGGCTKKEEMETENTVK
jgi:hypothetical protein